MQVLAAVRDAAGPYSTYINARLGHRYGAQSLRNILNGLVASGLLVRKGEPRGTYGYEWALTDAGRAALTEADNG
jgi:DNA-binding HxlR family transcriptional regulator